VYFPTPALLDLRMTSRAIFTTPMQRALSLAEKPGKHVKRRIFNLQA
jgi:hypothetical protein